MSLLPSEGAGLEVQVVRSFDKLLVTQQEWDEFMESIGGEIFLTFDWCKTWWKYYGKNRDLMIFLFRDAGSLCAILPMFSECIGLALADTTVVKMVGSDFLPITFSVPVRDDLLERIVPSFVSRLSEECRWDILYLGAICGKYPWIDRLVEALKAALHGAYCVDVSASEVQTYFQLANCWEDQVAGLSQRQRTKTRRVYKEIQSKAMSLSSAFATEPTVTQWFTDFVELHQAQWRQVGMPGHFADWPSSYEFHREMANVQLARDRLRLLQIRLDDNVIGYDYLYKFGPTYQWFLSARSPLGRDARIDFHRVSFGEKVQKAIRDRVRTIDGGRGEYEYKMVMGGKLFPVHSIMIYTRKPPGATRVRTFRALVWLMNVWYSKLWRRRIAPRLGIKPGPFWRLWIKTHSFSP